MFARLNSCTLPLRNSCHTFTHAPVIWKEEILYLSIYASAIGILVAVGYHFYGSKDDARWLNGAYVTWSIAGFLALGITSVYLQRVIGNRCC
jgi:hypothetical protein